MSFSPPAQARLVDRCLCTPDTFINRWNAADAVFTGTVTDVQPVPAFDKRFSTEKPVQVTVHVDGVFKNATAGQDFTLFDSIPHYTCMGYPYKKGVRYLFYAYMRREQTFEYWSAYKYPSGTFGGGGVCGGIKTYSDAATLPEIAQIKAELKAHPLASGFVGKLLNAQKSEQREKDIEDQ